METITLTYPHKLDRTRLPNTVAAIGFFDGIHKGHKKVIETAVNKAKQENKASAVISFFPHPSVVLSNDKKDVQYITTLQEKERYLNHLGVDYFYIVTFNKTLSQLSPQQFVDEFMIDLHITHIVAGFDFSFGFKGKGNMRNIGELTRDELTYQTIDKVSMDNKKISSTRIRTELANGDIEQVNTLLGRTYQTEGIVIHGEKRGRELGFPTANIDMDQLKLMPKAGIYAAKVLVGEESYIGLVSLGTNPTFQDEYHLTLEVNILDFDEYIYGEKIRLQWYQFIRSEVKFSSVDELIEQMKNDEQVIRQYFESNTSI